MAQKGYSQNEELKLNSSVIDLLDGNQDIVEKAFQKVRRFLERDEFVNEIYIRLAKYLKLDKVRSNNQFRMYLCKVAYHVVSEQLKANSPRSTLMAGGRSDNYDKLAESQDGYIREAMARTRLGERDHSDDINFFLSLKSTLTNEEFQVAEMLISGMKMSEIARTLDKRYGEIRNKIVASIGQKMKNINK